MSYDESQSIVNVKKTFNSNQIVEDYTQDVKNIGLWRSEKEIITKYFNKEDYILDIGCGAGRTTLNLYQKGYKDIVGIDFSKKMIKQAIKLSDKLNYDINFQIGNAMDLDFSDCKFDAAMFSYNGLMHIPKKNNRIKALKEIKRVLKHKSYFWFTAHDRKGIEKEYETMWEKKKKTWTENEKDQKLYEFGDMMININGEKTYFHFPTRKEVIDTIQKSGFELIDDLPRSEVCNELTRVKDNIANCRFYILRKL